MFISCAKTLCILKEYEKNIIIKITYINKGYFFIIVFPVNRYFFGAGILVNCKHNIYKINVMFTARPHSIILPFDGINQLNLYLFNLNKLATAAV